MKFNILRGVLAVLVGSIAANSCVAGTLSIIPTVKAAFENDGAFTPVAVLPDITKPQDRTMIYQVDLDLSVGNLTANERGFLNLGFNVGLKNLAIAADYSPDSSTVDSNGAAPGGVVAKYFANGDGGPSATDYQGIFATIANNLSAAVDPRVTLGQSSPSFLGSIFVTWDGKSAGELSINDLAASFNLISGTPASENQAAGQPLKFGEIPEPATVGMGLMGLIGIVAASRRRNA